MSSHLLTLVPRSRILLPWRWRRYVPPKRRFKQDLHSATSQKTEFIKNLIHFVFKFDTVHYEFRQSYLICIVFFWNYIYEAAASELLINVTESRWEIYVAGFGVNILSQSQAVFYFQLYLFPSARLLCTYFIHLISTICFGLSMMMAETCSRYQMYNVKKIVK
jgi:hypothetical protein